MISVSIRRKASSFLRISRTRYGAYSLSQIAAIVPSDSVDRRNGERGRLARAGWRFGQDVATRQEGRDRLLLDRRGFLVAKLGERGDQLTVNAERVEFGSCGGNGWLASIRHWAVGHWPILSPIALSGATWSFEANAGPAPDLRCGRGRGSRRG